MYLRIAEPAYEALTALLKRNPGPHSVLAHEYMGMPLALKAVLLPIYRRGRMRQS